MENKQPSDLLVIVVKISLNDRLLIYACEDEKSEMHAYTLNLNN